MTKEQRVVGGLALAPALFLDFAWFRVFPQPSAFREPIAARKNREADPAKQARGVIRLRPAVAGVRRDRLITDHSGITD